MGREFGAKGADIQLGPVSGPLGRTPEGGRNWEGFSPDPMLTGVFMAETIKGIQEAGVIACAKHYILNEQEHFRLAGEANGYGYNITASASSNIDDKTLHELYLWYFHHIRQYLMVHQLIFIQAICRCSARRSWLYHVLIQSSQQQLCMCE
jgi:beta-glucosidase